MDVPYTVWSKHTSVQQVLSNFQHNGGIINPCTSVSFSEEKIFKVFEGARIPNKSFLNFTKKQKIAGFGRGLCVAWVYFMSFVLLSMDIALNGDICLCRGFATLYCWYFPENVAFISCCRNPRVNEQRIYHSTIYEFITKEFTGHYCECHVWKDMIVRWLCRWKIPWYSQSHTKQEGRAYYCPIGQKTCVYPPHFWRKYSQWTHLLAR